MPSFNSKSYQDAFWSELTVNPERSAINSPQGRFLDSPDQSAPGSMPERNGHFRQPFDLGTPPKHRARAPFSTQGGKDTGGRWPFTGFDGWTGFGNISLPESTITIPPPTTGGDLTTTSGSGTPYETVTVEFNSTDVQSTPEPPEEETSSEEEEEEGTSSDEETSDPDDQIGANSNGCIPAGCCGGLQSGAGVKIGTTANQVINRGTADPSTAQSLAFDKCVEEGKLTGCNLDNGADTGASEPNYVVTEIEANIQVSGCPNVNDPNPENNAIYNGPINEDGEFGSIPLPPGGINVTIVWPNNTPDLGQPSVNTSVDQCCGNNTDINDCVVFKHEWKVTFEDHSLGANCSKFTCSTGDVKVECCCQNAEQDEGVERKGEDSPVFPPF